MLKQPEFLVLDFTDLKVNKPYSSQYLPTNTVTSPTFDMVPTNLRYDNHKNKYWCSSYCLSSSVCGARKKTNDGGGETSKSQVWTPSDSVWWSLWEIGTITTTVLFQQQVF